MDQNILEEGMTVSKPEVLGSIDPDQVRNQVVLVAKDFKNSWRNLACILSVVWAKRLYKQWGYEKFDGYTAKEVKIRKHTAMKLIRSYQFLQQEEPKYLQNESSEDKENAMPGWEAVSTLQRAKKQLPDEDYKKVKRYLLDDGKDVYEVKKDLTALITRQRKDVDVEQDRTKKGRVIVNKFLGVLQKFKQDVESLKIVPEYIVQDLETVAVKIQEYVDKSEYKT